MMNDLIQTKDVEHLLRVLGRKTRTSNVVRRPDIYSETISVGEMTTFLLCLVDNPTQESLLKRIHAYLHFHSRPEDYEAGHPVDYVGIVKGIAEKAQEEIENASESDWPGILSSALEEIVSCLSRYY